MRKANLYNINKREKKIVEDFESKFNRLGERFPRLADFLVVLKVFLGSTFLTLSIIGYELWSSRSVPGKILPAHTEPISESSKAPENPIERRVYDNKYETRCKGTEFDIVEELSIVGGERFTFPISEDDHVASVSGNTLYQGSQKTLWGCKPPYVVTIVVIPISGPSLGLFFEAENIYKVTIGDGDKVNVKLQRNNLGFRGEWEPLLRKKLSNPITDKQTVRLEIEERQEKEWIKLIIRVYYSGKVEPNEYTAEFIPLPNTEQDTIRKFRIGINDSRYKGEGSLVRLNSFSVREIEY